MSGRNYRLCLLAMMLELCCQSSVRAFELSQSLSPEFLASQSRSSKSSDPLNTMPEVLYSGVTLPGDDSPYPCSGKEENRTLFNLTDAVDIALCNNPQLRATWAAIKVQAASVGEARATYLPTVSGTLSGINDQTRYPGSNVRGSEINRQTAYGALNWRIFDFGGRSANNEAANWGLAAALGNHDALLQKTLSDAVQAYFDVLTAIAGWQSKSQNEAFAQMTLETSKRRENKGAGARSDTLQAATALARASLEKNRALGALHKANAVLVYALGLRPQTRLTLDDDVEAGEIPSSKELEAWLDETQKQHPAILAARAQLEAARRRVNAAKSDGLPTIDLTANYYENGRPGQGLSPTRTQERTIGIALSVPIFDGFSRTYKIRGAEAQVEQRQAELDNTEHQILMEVVKAYADASSALENLQYSEMLLSAAQESLGVSQRKYEKDVADILEVLNAQTALSDAKEQRIRSQAEWRSAKLRLLANVGLMGRTSIKK